MELKLRPFWKLVSPGGPLSDTTLAFYPGPGWGDGAHESTQLCLQAIAWFSPKDTWRMLDFGSGSGLLSLAGARLGAQVSGVEIDALAIEHANQNVAANALSERIRFVKNLEQVQGSFELVVANILKPVLMEFAPALVSRLTPQGTLVLSGITAAEVPDLSVRYAPLLGVEPQVFRQGEWRALVWRPCS